LDWQSGAVHALFWAKFRIAAAFLLPLIFLYKYGTILQLRGIGPKITALCTILVHAKLLSSRSLPEG
jgi:hypothetical protein